MSKTVKNGGQGANDQEIQEQPVLVGIAPAKRTRKVKTTGETKVQLEGGQVSAEGMSSAELQKVYENDPDLLVREQEQAQVDAATLQSDADGFVAEVGDKQAQENKISRKHEDLKGYMKESADFVFIDRLTKQIREDVRKLTRFDLRNLTKFYDMYQQMRIRSFNQFGATLASGEPQSETFAYIANNMVALEKRVELIMDIWSSSHPVGRWLRSIYGIGPVFAASLIGYINLEKAHSAAQVWAFAGLSPTQKRVKGQQSNWNPSLKSMCFLISGSLVRCGKVSPERYLQKIADWNEKHPDQPKHISQEEYDKVVREWNSDSNMYCRLYYSRREYEERLNAEGAYAEQAAALLASKNFESENALSYLTQGKLTPSHIDARCKRYIVKMLLAHTFEIMFEGKHGVVPTPYAIAHLDHVDIIPCPNHDLFIEDIRAASHLL